MAFSGMGSGSSGRRGRWGTGGSLSEMNVVPLVDVVLVLLIIFMLTASVMEFGLEVDVPTVKQSSATVPDDVVVVVAIDKNGGIFINDARVNINLLGETVRERFENAQDVFVRADRSIQWETVAQVVSALGEAKLGVKMVTKPEDIR